MMVTIPVWAAWVVVALALTGLIAVCRWVGGELRLAWDWWRDRRQPLDEEDNGCAYCNDENCPHGVPLEELPPERSREELGFTGPQPAVFGLATGANSSLPEAIQAPFIVGDLGPHRERRAPWYEAEYRHHYAAMDLDYPSGLLARVREAGR